MLKKDEGFTLIELLITMVILVIIATVAIPGFGRLIESNRLMTGTNLLASSIKLARAEAIKRGTNVTFSTDGGLETGWCVHAGDAAGDCANDQIRRFEAPDDLTFTETTGDLVFDRRGFLVPQNAQTFTVAPNGCAPGDITFRTLRISPVGRTEIEDGVCP
ncbi:GspH/FimT family pseudopilin [Marinobacter adhaerens]|jgi:type IV fimbrial biogenesis protein FimT|uniref:GspH/FimT family pseudopilin n=1 Tax=Marinobacter adhaerens TaxID=1033846 RepID=UPI000D4F1A09|nr:GspH/FimT family pseudopilin [Marinobacter adhaerens]MBW3228486.1 GspH/FimT family pseudopilin [Marinobacter adhaerens]PTB82344.1 pilus assembly protein [Marinobacter sp. Z-D5-3]